MKSHVLYKLHSALLRVIHLAFGVLSWLKRMTVRAVAFIKNTICMVFLVSLVTGCHMNRHVVTHVDDTGVSQTGHREQAVSSRLDSLFSQLSVSADSITMVLYGNASLRRRMVAHHSREGSRSRAGQRSRSGRL